MFNFGQGCDDVNRWLFKDKGAKSDNFLEPGIRNRLFLDKNGQSFDLAALNIQVNVLKAPHSSKIDIFFYPRKVK